MISLIKRHRMIVSYCICGTATAAVDFVVYFLCTRLFSVDVVPANMIAWIFSVLFSFFVNKLIVFQSKSWQMHIFLPQFFVFVGTRLISALMGTSLLWYLVYRLDIPDAIAKIISNIFVTGVNYGCGKLLFIHKRR